MTEPSLKKAKVIRQSATAMHIRHYLNLAWSKSGIGEEDKPQYINAVSKAKSGEGGRALRFYAWLTELIKYPTQ